MIRQSNAPESAIRYDPFNMGLAYAYVKGKWVECLSEYYSIFKECTEWEIQLASEELRRQNREQHRQTLLTARQLAIFLNSVEAAEILGQQRRRDQDTQTARGDTALNPIATTAAPPRLGGPSVEPTSSNSNTSKAKAAKLETAAVSRNLKGKPKGMVAPAPEAY